jgi:hypothetical protein
MLAHQSDVWSEDVLREEEGVEEENSLECTEMTHFLRYGILLSPTELKIGFRATPKINQSSLLTLK